MKGALCHTLFNVEVNGESEAYRKARECGTLFGDFVASIAQEERFYSETEIDNLQLIADHWGESLKGLGLADSLTNYAHCVIAGHVTDQMRRNG